MTRMRVVGRAPVSGYGQSVAGQGKLEALLSQTIIVREFQHKGRAAVGVICGSGRALLRLWPGALH